MCRFIIYFNNFILQHMFIFLKLPKLRVFHHTGVLDEVGGSAHVDIVQYPHIKTPRATMQGRVWWERHLQVAYPHVFPVVETWRTRSAQFLKLERGWIRVSVYCSRKKRWCFISLKCSSFLSRVFFISHAFTSLSFTPLYFDWQTMKQINCTEIFVLTFLVCSNLCT